ncbi:MAG: hypothetical protein ACLQRM_01560 [Acidimicrobiales bacterium]|jgi:hypothetical protein
MRISHPIRLGIAGAVIASGSFLFGLSAEASAFVVACPVARVAPPGASARRPAVATGASGQLRVAVAPLVFVTVESGVLRVSTNTGHAPATTDGFYLIRSGWAGHASARVVETVLRSCR